MYLASSNYIDGAKSGFQAREMQHLSVVNICEMNSAVCRSAIADGLANRTAIGVDGAQLCEPIFLAIARYGRSIILQKPAVE